MRRVSEKALAGFEVHGGLEVEMFGERIGPQLAFDLKRHDITLDIGVNLEISRNDARFKDLESFLQFFLQPIHVGSRKPAKLSGPVVNNGAVGLRVIFQLEGFHPLQAEVSLGIEEPIEIAQNALPVSLVGDDSLRAALLLLSRLIIGQPVEQAGLQLFDGNQFSHGSPPVVLASGDGSHLDAAAAQQWILVGIGGQDALAQAEACAT
jgi:hypothetical protein